MKYNYVYEIVWEYVYDDPEPHRTLVEVSRQSDTCARRSFSKVYDSIHRLYPMPYEVVSVRLLGKVIKKCW